jgi:hypothetical protein
MYQVLSIHTSGVFSCFLSLTEFYLLDVMSSNLLHMICFDLTKVNL